MQQLKLKDKKYFKKNKKKFKNSNKMPNFVPNLEMKMLNSKNNYMKKKKIRKLFQKNVKIYNMKWNN